MIIICKYKVIIRNTNLQLVDENIAMSTTVPIQSASNASMINQAIEHNFCS